LPCGLIIQSPEKLKPLIQELGIELGVIATQPSQAQSVADNLLEAGIKAIINFSPVQLRQPEGCLLENVDFSVKLDDLAYHLSKVK
jgi:redox-sensing transcriptional repressor